VIQITRRCNERCGMCRSWAFPTAGEITAPEITRLLRAMPDLVWLDVTGGEPFSRPDIADVWRRVLDDTPSLQVLHFPTNGWFTDRVAAAARAARALRPELSLIVTVSLDGPEALHDRMRGREGAWRRAAATWRALRAIPGVDVYVGTTLGPENRGALEATRAALADALPGFHDSLWHWNLYQASRLFFGNAPLRRDRAADARLVRRQAARRWPPRSPVDLMELAFLINLQATLDGEPLGMSCQSLRTACFVSAEAVLYPCHVWDRPVADLRAEGFDLARIWAGRGARDARRGAESLACGGCFTPCEAYPTLAGAPAAAAWRTARRGLALAARGGAA